MAHGHGSYLAVGLSILAEFVQDRERFAPKSLAAKKPVSQFVVDRSAPESCAFQALDDFGFCIFGAQTVKLSARNGDSLTGKANFATSNLFELLWGSLDRLDDLDDR